MIKDEYDFYTDHDAYERESLLFDRERIALEMAEKKILSGSHILDVGCGSGLFLKKLTERFPGSLCKGVDGSRDQVLRCEKKGLSVIQSDISEGIPFENNSFDFVNCAEVIEHVYDPDLLCDEIFRVIRPGGLLVLSTPNLHAWYNRIIFLMGILPVFMEVSTRDSSIGFGFLKRIKKGSSPVGHIRLMNRESVCEILTRAGFSVDKVKGATFEVIPSPVRLIDRIFRLIPSMSSILIVSATKVPKHES